MMVMTAKVDLKKTVWILAAVAAGILVLMSLLKGTDAQPTSATVTGNDARVAFLKDLGWDVTTSPVDSGQVRIPEERTEIFDRYNRLQQTQGYDLSDYAGKKVMRYVYLVNNYPGATDPVYATVLVYKNQVIGGDITDTAAGGQIRGLKTPTTPEETQAATG